MRININNKINFMYLLLYIQLNFLFKKYRIMHYFLFTITLKIINMLTLNL